MNAPKVHAVLADDEQTFKALMQRPYVAWPTLALFILAFGLYLASIWLGLNGVWANATVVCVNTLCAYALFTVAHDASHNSLSLHPFFNDLLGRISAAVLLPFPLFRLFRYVHMQHHRFSNEQDDPDMWVGRASVWSLPFRCATIDIYYMYYYLPKLWSRPIDQIRDVFLSILGGSVVIAGLLYFGWGMQVFLYWFLPARIAIFFLVLAFDVWPHAPYKATAKENKYLATNIRVGFERVLTPLLLSQNYHLVHHLYPLVPFYRYARVWRARERFHLEQNPFMVSMTGREVSKEAYLSKRSISGP